MIEKVIAIGTKGQFGIYYLLVFLSLVYLLYTYRKQKFFLLIILLFYNGLFGFLGKDAQNVYRIVLVIITLYWIIRLNLFNKLEGRGVLISSIFFTVTFLSTSFISDDYFQITFSQYSRYFILFSLFFILLKNRENVLLKDSLDNLIYKLLLLQVLLTLAKFFIIGLNESVVGSIASQGGAIATSLPILGLFFIWYNKKGVFERKDWIIIIGLLFIGFISGKRAVWFIFPVILALLMFYVPRRKIPGKLTLISLVTIPLVFYLGIRLNPTLNKEQKIWGSFDLVYAINYAETYSFGEQDIEERGSGRGSATLLLFDNFVNGTLQKTDWIGYGLKSIYATDYVEFSELGFGISGKGAATGVFQTMVSNGYIGILATLWFALSMLLYTKNRRLRIVLIGFFFWEYFFYTGIALREPALSFLLIYIVLFSPKKGFPEKRNIQLAGL